MILRVDHCVSVFEKDSGYHRSIAQGNFITYSGGMRGTNTNMYGNTHTASSVMGN